MSISVNISSITQSSVYISVLYTGSAPPFRYEYIIEDVTKATADNTATFTGLSPYKDYACTVIARYHALPPDTKTVLFKTLPIYVTSISQSDISLKKGENIQITPAILPTNASDKYLEMISSNTDVAIANAGQIISVDSGSCTVTLKATDGSNVIKTFNVTVTQAVKGIKCDVEKIEINPGESYQINATVIPTSATNKTLIYSSDSDQIANITTTGIVQGVQIGTANITVSTQDGNYSKIIPVNVRNGTIYTDIPLFVPDDKWDYNFLNNIENNLLYLYNQLTSKYNYVISTLTYINFGDLSNPSPLACKNFCNWIEGNIDKIENGVDFDIPSYKSSKYYERLCPYLPDLNRMINICKEIKTFCDTH